MAASSFFSLPAEAADRLAELLSFHNPSFENLDVLLILQYDHQINFRSQNH